MHSHHSHSGQFCRHAKDNLESVVARAVELGFTAYGLTEHAPRYREEDLFPEEVSVSMYFGCGSYARRSRCLEAGLIIPAYAHETRPT